VTAPAGGHGHPPDTACGAPVPAGAGAAAGTAGASAGEAETPAARYQRLTCYDQERHWLVPADDPAVRQDFLPMLAELQPPSQKTFPAGLPRVQLPADPGDPAAERARAPLSAPAGPGVAELGWLLHWSAGVVRERVRRSGQPIRFRAAGSAGNLHPVEIYLNSSGVPGLGDGVWHYDPSGHELVKVAPQAATGPAVIVTGVPWRTQWRYSERGYRHLWWDAGSVASHLELLTGVTARRLRVRLCFPDTVVAAALGASERHEPPLAVIELDGGIGRLRPGGPAAVGDLGAAGPVFPLVEEVHEAGRIHDWPAADAAATVPASPPAGPGKPAEPGATLLDGLSPAAAVALVRARFAARSFRREAAPLAAVTGVLAAAARPLAWDAGDAGTAWVVFAHDVTGLPPGCYHAGPGGLRPVQSGESREAAAASCLDQPAARDCAFLLLAAGDLDGQLRRRGQRGYRELQFWAGMAAGRLQLAALAAGLGSTPLTVRDTTAARFVPAGMVPLIAVAVGPAVSRPSPAGLPRAPVRVGQPRPHP
jgi:nitroreductase family protein